MFLYELIILLAIIGLDIGSKYFIVAVFEKRFYEPIPVIPKVVDFEFCKNTGAGFGIFQGKTTLLAVVTALCMVVLLVYLFYAKKDSKLMRLSLIFIIGGGLGNFYDRVVLGYVRDFIHTLFIDFPTFNVADSFVTVGAVLMVVYLIFFASEDFKKQEAEKNKSQGDIVYRPPQKTDDGSQNG